MPRKRNNYDGIVACSSVMMWAATLVFFLAGALFVAMVAVLGQAMGPIGYVYGAVVGGTYLLILTVLSVSLWGFAQAMLALREIALNSRKS